MPPIHPWSLLYDDGKGLVASEADCLSLINDYFPARSDHFEMDRDDDCATLNVDSGQIALSTDYFWENAHFRAAYFTPAEVGAKALSVAVSDLAAAGAVPLGFSMGLMIPGYLPRRALEDLLSGMAEKADEYKIVLTGGDLTRSPGAETGLCVTVWGGPVEEDAEFLSRGCCLPGDCIFMIGQSGLAGVGLHMLEKMGRHALDQWPAAGMAHLDPAVYLEEGQTLARLARNMEEYYPRIGLMDLSDGLARDLPRLLGGMRDRREDSSEPAVSEELGANLDFDPGIIPHEVREAAAAMNATAETLFVRGGEDYALIGTCAEYAWQEIKRAEPAAVRLGTVIDRPGIFMHGLRFDGAGFDHFSGTKNSK